MKSAFAFVIAIVFNTVSAAEIDPSAGCKNNPAVAAACFAVRGRISAYQGAPVLRIWPIGTRRLLGVVPSEKEIVPGNIRGKVTAEQSVFANFEVCPFETARSGAMQSVCIESASHLSIRRER